MKRVNPYNPLDKLNLAKSIGSELLSRESDPLSNVDHIIGAGVYAIYYFGPFPAYTPISNDPNLPNERSTPIYVGKAIPKGGRKGGLVEDASSGGRALASRLRGHATSISEAANLELADFSVRHLVVDDIWIPLGENVLIENFRPVWNIALDGFGNKDAGIRRAAQYKSQWDIVHPGRKFAEKQAESPLTQAWLLKRIEDYLAGRAMEKLPKAIQDQEAEQQSEAEEIADEI
jgi:hypothetical protein